MRVIINLNDKVKFKITEFGKKALQDYLIKLKDHYSMPDFVIERLKEKYSKEDIEMCLWDFMNIFGPVSKLGTDNICKDNEIETWSD